MEDSPRIEEAFQKISRSVDAITKHLNSVEIEMLQDKLIIGLISNKRRRNLPESIKSQKLKFLNKKYS